jgi:hypothetical protein
MAAVGYRTPTARPPHAVEPGFHGVRTQWIRGFMALKLSPAHPDLTV